MEKFDHNLLLDEDLDDFQSIHPFVPVESSTWGGHPHFPDYDAWYSLLMSSTAARKKTPIKGKLLLVTKSKSLQEC